VVVVLEFRFGEPSSYKPLVQSPLSLGRESVEESVEESV
jgi:hypothetical protein